MQKTAFSLVAFFTALCAVAPAYAAQVGPVDVSVDYVAEWQNEFRAESQDAAIDGTNNTFTRVEVAPEIEIGEHFEIESLVVFEPFEQAAAKNTGKDIWFESQGAYVENLYLEYEVGALDVLVGKFNPSYGVAWDYGRGIWGEDFAEDYEVTEKVGAGVAYEFDTKGMGEHTVSLNTFFNDTSFLSGSAITARDDNSLKAGGAGNTEDFSSFVGQVEGEDAAGVEDLGYRVAYRYLAEQDKNRSATTDAESGYLLGANYAFDVSDAITLDSLVEYTHIDNFAGVANADRDYYYASVVTNIYERWNVTTGVTFRDISGAGATKADDVLLNLTGGYDFDNGLTLEGGYRGSEEAQQETHIVGFLLRYVGEWE